MDISEYGSSPHVDPLIAQLQEYDLFKHVVELEAYGLTIVPKEKMGVDDGFVERLRSAILATCEKRNGLEIGDYRTAEPNAKDIGRNSWYLLQEDDVFVEAATNPRLLALVRWLCGQSAVLSGHTWIIKPPGGRTHTLHSDAHGIPPGGGSIAHACNASWLCTDYTSVEDGPTVFVPGSHRYGRATLPHEESVEDTPFNTVPLIAEAGSLALWNGATWHASLPRTNPGLRITLVQIFMRMHMRPIHLWENEVAPELIEKYPELKRVLGEHLYPYKESISDFDRVAPFKKTGTDPFA